MQKVTFGGGCFWCTEAVFQNLSGVEVVVSGYMGGKTEHPTYDEVSSGNSGHAEVVQVTFDEEKITFEELLLVFFKTHDPTTLNKQGNDIGTQYKSVVFYDGEEQKYQTEQMIARLNSEKVFDQPIVTEISPITCFYEAENYHQNYFNQNRDKPYCAFVIQPKLDEFSADFKEKVKPGMVHH